MPANPTKRLVKNPRRGLQHHAQVPPSDYYDTYISRDIAGKSEFDIFQYAREERFNVLIEGPTGPGKTSAVLAFAAREKLPFYAVPSNVGVEPSQLFGKFIPDRENGGFVWVDGPVTSVVRNGGVLLINEVNFMPDRVATVLFGLLDKRRQIILLDHEAEVIDAADDLLIVADMNPDYEGTRPLNKAFRNRFGIQLWWDYDPNVEASLIVSPRLRELAQKIREDVAKGAYNTPVSTNMLQEFERVFDDMGMEFAITNFVNHFATDERPPIRQLVITCKNEIENEIAAHHAARDAAVTDGEKLGSIYPDDDPIWITREEAADGYVDPEWGVKGREWVFATD